MGVCMRSPSMATKTGDQADIASLGTPVNPYGVQAQRPKKDSRVTMWIALISAAGAMALPVVASVQVHEASQQNILSVEQQLLQLTTNIAQQYDEQTITIDQAAGRLTGSARTSALSAAGVALTDQLLAEGEAGEVLISYLGGRGTVASIEYMEVANALLVGEDDGAAIQYYRDAINALPRAPLAQADALRSEGNVYYNLGETKTGHALMMQAVAVYTGNKDLTKLQIADSVGQSFAADAWNEMYARNCKVGLAEFTDARKLLAPADGGSITDEEWISSDRAASKKYCASGSTNVSSG